MKKLDNVVDPSIDLALQRGHMKCGNGYLKLSAAKHMNPFTVEFLEAPAGFVPQDFNSAGLGPFTGDSVDYGNEELAVPFGNYVVKITDACGRTAEESILIEFEELNPTVVGTNNGCFSLFGKIRINISDQLLTSAVIVAAPSAYMDNFTLPQDVTSFINSDGKLVLNDMPIGIYIITFTDDCGFSYTEEVEVPPFVERNFIIETLPDCSPGHGTVKINSKNGDLTSVVITDAPESYIGTDFDISASINSDNGDLYVNNLPEGDYTFTAIDICGIVKVLTIEVIGYVPPQESVLFFPNCGSFSVQIQDEGNGIDQVAYFMQIIINPHFVRASGQIFKYT